MNREFRLRRIEAPRVSREFSPRRSDCDEEGYISFFKGSVVHTEIGSGRRYTIDPGPEHLRVYLDDGAPLCSMCDSPAAEGDVLCVDCLEDERAREEEESGDRWDGCR